MKLVIGTILLLVSAVCFAQGLRTNVLPPDDFSSNKPSTSPTTRGTDYRIGSDDKLDVSVFEIAELAATPRVSASGNISLGPIGTLNAGGLTPEELERAIEKALVDKKLVNEPRVTVTIVEYASQPVSIMGAVKMPNIYQVKGEKTLSSMLAQAQGLDPNTVGSTIQVIRAPKVGVEREVINIDVLDFVRGNVELDIPIYANDRINVQAAESIFVMGEVKLPGEFVLKNGMPLTVLKAVTKAGDFTKEAKKKESRIIRVHEDGSREEIKLDIDKMKDGKAADVELMANDILLIPPNRVKAMLNKTVESTIGVVSGRLIYRF